MKLIMQGKPFASARDIFVYFGRAGWLIVQFV